MYKIKLSPYSKTFYNEWLLNPGCSNYNIVVDQILSGNLDSNRLARALERYVSEHVILNSHIVNINDELYWVPNTRINKLEHSDDIVQHSKLLNYVSRSFDLHNEPLYRFKLLRISNDSYRFIIVLHHLTIDGSSTDKGLFEALSSYYNDESYTIEHSIDEQIKLLINLENDLSVRLKQNKHEYMEFWRNQLRDIDGIDLKFLKLDKKREEENLAEEGVSLGEVRFCYEEGEIDKFSCIKRKYVITPYIYSLCIFAILINKYTDQKQFVISYATSIKEGTDFIYGAQVNTCFIPYKFDKNTTIVDLFNQSKEFFKSLKQGVFNYSYYPVVDIIQESSKSLLNLYFIQPNLKDKAFAFTGITKVEILDEFNLDSVDPLVFEQALGNKSKRLDYRVRYDKNIINEELLNNFVGSFKKLFTDVLNDLVSDNTVPTASLYDVLNSKQHQQLIYDFNKTESEYPKNETLSQLFEKQVKNTPDNVAIIFENISITYRELDDRACQLAFYLKILGIEAGESVALYMQRSLDSVVAIVSIIKIGALYVPLDPTHPYNRIQYMVDDSGCHFCLTSDELFDQCRIALSGNQETNIVRVSEAYKNNLSINTKTNNYAGHPMDAAYIMYTSGSTGQPKGIKISHRGIVRLVKNTNYILFHPEDRVSHATSISFDISTVEIWGSLLNGLTMVIIPQDTLINFKELSKLLQDQAVTIMCIAPAVFNAIVATHCDILSNLRYLLVCGEKLIPQNMPQFFASNKTTILVNCYGPTECTSYATTFEIPRNWPADRDIPIGKPIANTTAYVLDTNLQSLPIGAVGELCLGGDGLAICYHNKPDMTNDKFVNILLDKKNQTRAYKTGDLVRMLPDGNLEFIGRNDFQVKIRGYRVELGEIESKLISYPGIKQAIVLVKEHLDAGNYSENDKYLVVYYLADTQLDETKIQDYLIAQLPKYMLPSALIYLKNLPLTVNGKLDRNALPEAKFISSDQYTLLNNKQEQLICEAFAKILGLKTVGINDDFFKLGGNSLKAISLTSFLQAQFDIKIADIFNLRTPKKIAKNLCYAQGMLEKRLEKIKALYQNKQSEKHIVGEQVQNKIDNYLKDVQKWKFDCSLKKLISNVLLTGATGYLGCNILNQLLKLTDYNIFLLVRADSQAEAIDRLNKKFQFYFDKTLDDVYGLRVFVIKSDIEKSYLGLSPKYYQALTAKIDSVIHAAALVKQYGEYDKFYSANVQATINLLELTKLTKLKDFHYMSSGAVLTFGFTSDDEEHIFTEDDIPSSIDKYYNVYSKTKLQGEHQAVKYREYGINSSIYRLGNLAFMVENHRSQENIDDNGFFGFLQFLFKIKCIASEFSLAEISPVDLTAQAVVKLFDKKKLDNNIYHLFNHYLFDLPDFFAHSKTLVIKVLTVEQFINSLSYDLNDGIKHDLIVKFLSRQGWLDADNINYNISILINRILQDKTQYILKQLNFEWSPISNELFSSYIGNIKTITE